MRARILNVVVSEVLTAYLINISLTFLVTVTNLTAIPNKERVTTPAEYQRGVAPRGYVGHLYAAESFNRYIFLTTVTLSKPIDC